VIKMETKQPETHFNIIVPCYATLKGYFAMDVGIPSHYLANNEPVFIPLPALKRELSFWR